MPSIAIIGAGCSGLAAAHVLQEAGYTVTLFEKSDDVGGRAITEKRDGFIYDYGAQYIKGSSPVSEELITKRFRVDVLIDIRAITADSRDLRFTGTRRREARDQVDQTGERGIGCETTTQLRTGE